MHTPVTKPIRVMLVDEQAVVRSGLRLLIENQPGMTVVGEASTGSDALAVAEHEQPDIILLVLAGIAAINLVPELLAAAKGARILILTSIFDLEAHKRAMRLGAMGVVFKEKAPEVLIKALEKVHEGELWLDRSMVANVFGGRARASEATKHDPDAAKIATLTKREREVIALVGEGLKNKQIAERLFISEGTVRNHLTQIFRKLEVADRVALMVYAYRRGLAKPPF